MSAFYLDSSEGLRVDFPLAQPFTAGAKPTLLCSAPFTGQCARRLACKPRKRG